MIVDVNKIKKSVGIIGESGAIEEMCTLIGQIANTDISVLVTGESGSGKGVVARALHHASQRSGAPFVEVNYHRSAPLIPSSDCLARKVTALSKLVPWMKPITEHWFWMRLVTLI